MVGKMQLFGIFLVGKMQIFVEFLLEKCNNISGKRYVGKKNYKKDIGLV